MDLGVYQAQAARTLNHNGVNKKTALHVVTLGLASEVGEIASEIKKAVEQERDVNLAKIREEAGDVAWYLAGILTLLNISLEGCLEDNIAKLQRRYPDGFTPQASIARMDKANGNG
jgi:NTP pyrophosphatase (non-canonical NTP hydrolase)